MKVKDCMCNNVCFAKPETNIQEIAKMMSDNHIGSVPICDNNNQICGIVTDRDILLRCVACNKDAKQTPVSDIMTCNVCTCNENDDMTRAEVQMSKNQIRRLPVCDNNNKVIGMLTLGDLAQNDIQIGKQEVSATMRNICNCNGQNKNAE